MSLRWYEEQERSAHHLLCTVAEQALGLGIPPHDGTVWSPAPKGVAGAVDNGRKGKLVILLRLTVGAACGKPFARFGGALFELLARAASLTGSHDWLPLQVGHFGARVDVKDQGTQPLG